MCNRANFNSDLMQHDALQKYSMQSYSIYNEIITTEPEETQHNISVAVV